MRLIIAAVFLLATAVAEARWVVQIGAFSGEVDAGFLDAASHLGEIRTEPRQGNNVSVVVGPWQDINDARATLPRILAQHPDAFIRRQGDRGELVVERRAQVATAVVAIPTVGRMASNLSQDEQRNVVLLDGQPHYKSGDTFTPLETYLHKRNR